MTIEYKLTYSEAAQSFRIGNRHAFRTNPVFFYLLYGICGLLLVGCGLYDFAIHYARWRSLGITPGPAQYSEVLLVFWPAIAAVLFSPWFIPASLASIPGRVEINSSGVVLSSGPKPVLTPWDCVSIVDEEGPFIFIGFGQGKSRGRSTIIPRRVFASNQEAQAFFDQAVAYRDQAKAAPVEAEPSTAWPPAPSAGRQGDTDQ